MKSEWRTAAAGTPLCVISNPLAKYEIVCLEGCICVSAAGLLCIKFGAFCGLCNKNVPQ